MATVKERQRARRERLMQAGLTELSVTVPDGQVDRLRAINEMLKAGQPVAARLIPALRALRAAHDELAANGVVRAGVFGSTARGEDRAGSDLDLVLTLGGQRDIHPYRLMDLRDLAAARINDVLPDVTVDVAFYEALTPSVRAEVDRDVIYAD